MFSFPGEGEWAEWKLLLAAESLLSYDEFEEKPRSSKKDL